MEFTLWSARKNIDRVYNVFTSDTVSNVKIYVDIFLDTFTCLVSWFKLFFKFEFFR